MKKNGRYFDDIDIHLCATRETDAHSHTYFELAYVVSGAAEHVLNGCASVIEKGSYFILDYNAVHSYKARGDDFLLINFLFTAEFIDKALKCCTNFGEIVNNYMIKYSCTTVNISPANYIFTDADGEIGALITDMLSEYKEKKAGSYEIIRCKLIEIIILTMRKSAPPSNRSGDGICSLMISFAEDNLSEKKILSMAAEKLNFSKSYLSKRFKMQMGTEFSSYLQRMRIEQSCRLIANTDKKITEIAQLVGYGDMKYFNSVFKKFLGVTPGRFRSQLGK